MALSNSQYNAIMREYDMIRFAHHENKRQREEELKQKLPEYFEFENAAAELTKNYALQMLQADARDRKRMEEEFGRELSEISKKKAALLQKAGYPADYMETEYSCSLCKDTGRTEEGRCICFRKKVQTLLYHQFVRSENLEKDNFDHFSLEHYDRSKEIPELGMTIRDYMEKVYQLCIRYTKNFPEGAESILFTGNTGVGKTFLSVCIAKALIERSFFVLYFTASDFFDYYAKEKLGRDTDYIQEEQEDSLPDCDLLILDDLGTEFSNTFTVSALFSVLNARMLRKKPMIISTNLDLNGLRNIYSERISSRIAGEYTVIRLYGDDIRQRL